MYPLQMRKKVLEIKKKEKISIVSAAKRFGISPTTVFKWTKRLEAKKAREKTSSKNRYEGIARRCQRESNAYQYERAVSLE